MFEPHLLPHRLPPRVSALVLLGLVVATGARAGGDVTPPTVAQTSTVAGPLAECDAVRLTVFSTRFRFSEPVQDPDGDTQMIDATNPESYLLVMPGEDGDFQTTSCAAGADPLDERVTIDLVFYAADLDTYFAANFNRLVDGQYRLFACAESIRDLAGNRLDGDGDGTGGDDFRRVFRMDQFNQIENGHFDCDLEGWTLLDPGFELDLGNDAGGSSESGSILLAEPAGSRSSLAQCVQVGPNGLSTFFVRLRPELAGGALVSYTQSCELFPFDGCLGPVLGQVADTYDLFDTGGVWVPLLGELLQVPPLARSGLCRFDFDDLGGPLAVSADQFFYDGGAAILRDGMEGGSLGGWPERSP